VLVAVALTSNCPVIPEGTVTVIEAKPVADGANVRDEDENTGMGHPDGGVEERLNVRLAHTAVSLLVTFTV
jgi:hypothetical protein